MKTDIRNGISWLLVICAAAVIACGGCATRETTDPDLVPRTFGIVNRFPDHPNYLKKRTLTAMHRIAAVDGLDLRPVLTEAVASFLRDKGYRVVEVEGDEALTDGRADMIIEMIPRAVYKMDGTMGYGFVDREFLLGLVKNAPVSYVAMELAFKRKNSVRIIRTQKEERFSRLDIQGMMPDRWAELSAEQQAAFERNLRENLIVTVRRLLETLKI